MKPQSPGTWTYKKSGHTIDLHLRNILERIIDLHYFKSITRAWQYRWLVLLKTYFSAHMPALYHFKNISRTILLICSAVKIICIHVWPYHWPALFKKICLTRRSNSEVVGIPPHFHPSRDFSVFFLLFFLLSLFAANSPGAFYAPLNAATLETSNFLT